jgi:nitrile hydratase accessory protein
LSLPEQGAPLARNDGEPVFDEPWQAQVMALAFTLMEQGTFTNAVWSETLGAKLKAAASDGKPDTPDTYYQCALVALESLLSSSEAIPRSALDERTETWRQAYLDTPHGEPVKIYKGET